MVIRDVFGFGGVGGRRATTAFWRQAREHQRLLGCLVWKAVPQRSQVPVRSTAAAGSWLTRFWRTARSRQAREHQRLLG